GLFDDAVPNSDQSFNREGEPGTTRLIRTAAKAFAPGVDEKSGCFGPFFVYIKDFLKENRLLSLPLESFRGSRFNILFSIAASVYFLRDQMLSYLDDVTAKNRLLKAVQADLKVEEFVAGCKALGLVSKLITCPLWNVIEKKDVSILDMNMKYLQLVNFCTNARDNLDEFISGKLLIFEDQTYVERDCIWDKLIEPSQFDGTVKVMLEILLPALSKLCQRIFADHLPGGRYGDIDTADPALRKKYQSVPKSSKFAESIFGMLDYQIRAKPNASMLAIEASIAFAQNKTKQWLEAKGEDDIQRSITQARSDARQIRRDFKERKNTITEERRRALRMKIAKNEETKQRIIQRQEQITQDMIEFGLWQTEAEVENQVKSFTSKKLQLAALTAQLRFREKVLHQQPGGGRQQAFTISKKEGEKRVNLSVGELEEKVKSLVSQAMVRNDHGDSGHILTGKRVRHRFSAEDGSHELDWHSAKVINQVPGFQEWWNLKYDGDDCIYTYRLEYDMQIGI
ncbi:hypothetical protein CAPTEDRAFT_217367, partial [Capitella teleta]